MNYMKVSMKSYADSRARYSSRHMALTVDTLICGLDFRLLVSE